MTKPSWLPSLLVFFGILGLYIFVMCLEAIATSFLRWLDGLPVADRRFVLLAVPLALVVGLWIRHVRRE